MGSTSPSIFSSRTTGLEGCSSAEAEGKREKSARLKRPGRIGRENLKSRAVIPLRLSMRVAGEKCCHDPSTPRPALKNRAQEKAGRSGRDDREGALALSTSAARGRRRVGISAHLHWAWGFAGARAI